MRRSLAGLLFGLAFACATVAICGFLLERTAFSPAHTYASADVVLQDSAVRDELVRVITTSTVLHLANGDADSAALITKNVGIVASTPAGAVLMAEVLRDAHEHLIGRQPEPVQITGQQLVQIVRDERAAVLDPIVIDVPELTAMHAVDQPLRWIVPIAAIAAVVLFALCLLAHPDRAALTRTLGVGLVVLAALVLVVGWAVPAFLPPLLTDSPYGRIPHALAMDSLPLLLGAALAMTGVGLGLVALAGRISRSRRWSSPVSTYRYREDRRWS